MDNSFKMILNKFLVLLHYSKQDKEYLSCSWPLLFLPSRPHSLVIPLLLNRTGSNILPLWKDMIPGSLYPLQCSVKANVESSRGRLS